ncbi:DUF6493 family protein [Solirubrobacter ginsenosidimutans]|uniref:DUF6493 family protein n=1 Tax=Solirubrobacter ginsenosidimutans TaxID=490573 RepID=A0A9X3RY57_9ACTN|nr:DUF6493 family protein [Solirubrobacter ginsenosidimutans]MDA0158804.1 DUF6493 family protein [Solirubrobacter ginsenosidimutans]
MTALPTNLSELITGLHGLPEPERRKHAPGLLRSVRAITTDSSSDAHVRWGEIALLQVALAGTATFTEIRRLGRWWAVQIDPELGAAVLLDRRPAWLADYVAWLLGADETNPPWTLVRALVQAGAIERPPAPLYLNALVTHGRDIGARRAVQRDPALLEHEFWALLTADTGQESLRAADVSNEWTKGAGFNAVIAECAADGRMPRERVLDALLDGLANDMIAYRATWHTKLWKDLAPTRAERIARVDRLRVLLGAAVEPIVGFAVEELARSGVAVPAADLTPALAASTKKTVRTALKLLDEAPAQAAIALGHPDAAIQGEVLDRLERWTLDAAGRDALLLQLDVMAATVRPRAEALLGLALPTTLETVEVDLDDIPQPIQEALNFGGAVPLAPVPGEPVLGEPLDAATLDELAESLGTKWTRDERLVDLILRECGSRAPFEGPLAALVERLPWFVEHQHCEWPIHVAGAWLTGTVADLSDRPETWHRRLFAASRRAARGEAGRLLALPTHVGGWIEPAVLVTRLREAADADEEELATALLRIAPDGRAPALDAAADVEGRPGALLRCALGGEPIEDAGPAAAAARAVAGVAPVTVELTLDLDGVRPIDRFVLTHDGPTGDGPLADLLAVTEPSERERWHQTPDQFVYPGRRDLGAAGVINRLGWNLDTEYTMLSGAHELFPPLLLPTEPIAPMTARCLLLALGSSVADEHLLAADVLIAAIEDGRVDATTLAHGRADLPAIKPNRLAPRLQAIAEAGPLQRAVVRDLLDLTIEAAPARSGPLLVLFDELCAQTATGPRASREHLGTLKHKAAKALAKRAGDPPKHERQLALAARVRRARRWMERT